MRFAGLHHCRSALRKRCFQMNKPMHADLELHYTQSLNSSACCSLSRGRNPYTLGQDQVQRCVLHFRARHTGSQEQARKAVPAPGGRSASHHNTTKTIAFSGVLRGGAGAFVVGACTGQTGGPAPALVPARAPSMLPPRGPGSEAPGRVISRIGTHPSAGTRS